MKKELICDNCGGKNFDFRVSSRKLGGWDEDGERIHTRESFYCKKCDCEIEIIYHDKKSTAKTRGTN